MQKDNNSALKKALAFAEDKGFYIILALCIVAIGVSGYVLFFTGEDTPDTPLSLEEITLPTGTTRPAEITAPPTQPTTQRPTEVSTTMAVEVPVVSPTEVPVVPPRTTEVSNPIKVPELKFVLPHSGQVSRPFSGQELVKDPTMGDWRTHKGVDIDCRQGDEILVITAGTVSGVFTDPMMGNCVSVTHEGGLVSTYCGLDANKTMKVGLELKAGDPVGVAGNTVLAESAQPCHVHIEMTKDGTHIDPLSVID